MGVHRYLHASRWNWWTKTSLDPVVASFNTLSGTNLVPIQNMVSSIKAAGFWDKLTDIYPFAGLTIASQAVNLKTPGTNSITFKTGGTYGVGGMTPSGVPVAEDNMLSTPPLMIAANRSFSCGAYYSNTVPRADSLSIKLNSGNGVYHVYSDGNVYPEIYGLNQGLNFVLGASKMVSLSTVGGSQSIYSAGALTGSAAIVGNNGADGVSASIGSNNISTFSVAFFGYNLSNSEQATMYSICDAYNSSMGR